MSCYVRPRVAEQIYRDAAGTVIEYGNRWGTKGPPADSYSVDTHPERFAPLHQIADALIDHLQHDYEVDVRDDLSCVQDVTYEVDAIRSIRLTPTEGDAAGLTFVFTPYPGVIVHAGLLHDFRYPICGCDACDESVTSVADELEWHVQAVVSGGYREGVRGSGREAWMWYQLAAADGSFSESGAGAARDAGARLPAASRRLNSLPAGWAAWTRK